MVDDVHPLEAPYEINANRFDVAFDWPLCLRWWLMIELSSACAKTVARKALGVNYPACFALHGDLACRLVMASRFGDVGISFELVDCDAVYDARVTLDELTDFVDSRSAILRRMEKPTHVGVKGKRTET